MPIYIYLILGVVLLLAFLLLNSPGVKGRLGEFRVNRAIRRELDGADYVLLSDVTLYDEEGTTQIDHLIVSRYGIFVIETKNIKGWIFGAEKQHKWTGSIYRKKFHFQNPLRQNYRHVKALESALSLEPKYFHSVIAFVGDCTLKTEMPENVVVGVPALIRYIKSFGKEQFSSSQMSVLIERIEGIRLSRGRATDTLHIENLRAEGKPVGRRGHSARNLIKSTIILFMAVALLLFFTQFNSTIDTHQISSEDNVSRSAMSESANQAVVEAGRSISTNPEYKNTREVAPLYLIELKSGGSLYAKNIVRTKNSVAYEDGKGLITTLNKADIVEIKKLR